jgi:tetratricopeptide (TPR) repeat protein
MSFSLKSLALSSLAVLAISLPAFAQTATIEGIVKDESGKPIQNAVVNIDRTDIKAHYGLKTDKKGHYGHYGLPVPGMYDITVLVDGQVRDGIKGVRTAGEPVKQDFNLKAPGQAAAAGAPGAPPQTPAEQERGLTKAQKEEFEKQAKAREAQIAKNKELNDAYTAGKTALDAKMFDDAITNLSKASMIDDKQIAIWSALADAYVGSAGTKTASEASGQYDKAFDAFKKAIELSTSLSPGEQAAYYNNYALALAKDKKIDDARTNLDKAAMLDPMGAGKYFYNMGALLVNSNQNDAAGDEFKKAIAADPNYADAYYQLGLYLTSKATADPKGNIVAAPGTIENLQKYLQLKPDGNFAPNAKELISSLGGTVNTNFRNPSSPAPKKKK